MNSIPFGSSFQELTGLLSQTGPRLLFFLLHYIQYLKEPAFVLSLVGLSLFERKAVAKINVSIRNFQMFSEVFFRPALASSYVGHEPSAVFASYTVSVTCTLGPSPRRGPPFRKAGAKIDDSFPPFQMFSEHFCVNVCYGVEREWVRRGKSPQKHDRRFYISERLPGTALDSRVIF